MTNIDIATLKSQVQSGLSGTDYALPLPPLGALPLTALANATLPDATLRLSAATLEEPPDGQSILVHGTGVDLPFTDLQCTARFFLLAGIPSLQLSAVGTANWLLSTGFPPFEESLIDELRFVNAPPPALYLYSDPSSDGRLAGLTFEGNLDLSTLTGGLSSLLRRNTQPISGSFDLEEQGATLDSFSLTGEITSGINLGIADKVDITFGVGGWFGTNQDDGEGYVLPNITLGITLPFNAHGKSYPLPMAVTIFNLQDDFRFETNLTGLVDAAVDEMKALAQNIGLEDVLPKGDFQLQNYISLSNFFFDFDPTTTPPVTQIGLDVQNAHPWTIAHFSDANKDWVLEEALLSLRVMNPGSASSHKALLVSGELKIGASGVLLLSTRYPTWEFDFALKQGTVLNLTEVLEEFLGNAAGVPTILVEAFELHLAAGNYSLLLEMADDWVLGDNLLALRDVGLTLEHQTGTGGAGTQAAMFGILDVCDVSVILDASYSGTPDAGWHFQGSTTPGQSIPIGQLIDDLAMRFGDVILPTALADLTINNISVSFDTNGTSFTFSCESQLPVENALVSITLDIAILKANNTYTKTFDGTVTIGTRQFALLFSEDATATFFIATYANPGGDKISIKEDIVAPISATAAQDIPAGLAVDFKDVLLVLSRAAGTEPTFVFGLDLGINIPSLSNLPLVGQMLPANETISVNNLRVLVASKALTQDVVAVLNGLLGSGFAPLPDADLKQGLTLAAAFNFGGTPRMLTVPIASAASPTTTTPALAASAANATTTDNATWFSLQKAFGPVYFNRVGVQYQDAAIWFLLDAALTLAGLTLSLEGLSFGSPVSKFEMEFQLRGLGLDYQEGPVEIGGAFLHVQEKLPDGTTLDEYEGLAIIKTEELTLSALGAYADLNGHPSLFIYAILDYPLGGPTFFFITGLAAGFGYNRALTVPSIDQVAQFPLVVDAVSGAVPAQNAHDLGNELAKFGQYIYPQLGEIFFAIGIKYTSFKLIDSFALLTVAFGNEFEIDVLGLSTLVLPTPVPGAPNPTPLAVVQMAVKASFIPALGFLGVSAQLTAASYLLSGNCRLTGGFAFYSWFAGEHEGDFVQTLGGYHPSFVVPAHYPTVPRLGFQWQVDDSISIKGEAYGALTASALMAGMHVQATWHSGSFRAWFNAAFDFLLSWKPFHYDISLSVDLGASYTFHFFGTHTISVDVGADLHVWGPEFSGWAHVKLSIISFDVSFGANASHTPAPIDWPTFKKSFLPDDSAVVGVSVKGGLVSKQGQDAVDLGVLDPKRFSLVTNAMVPASNAYIQQSPSLTQIYYTTNGPQPYTARATDGALVQAPSAQTKALGQIAIGSMGVEVNEFSSTHAISITRNGTHVESHFAYTPVLKSVPVGLWGHTISPELNGPRFIDNALTGFEITPAAALGTGATIEIDTSKLRFEANTIPSAYAWAPAPAPFQTDALDDTSSRQRISTTLISPTVAAARQQLLAQLGISAEQIDLSEATISALADGFVIAPQIEKVP
jgi:hypothetical protein